MANIGATTAFYKVETSLTRANNEVSKSMERLATGKANANAGDRSSYVAMADTFRLDFVGTKAGIKGASVVMGYLETGMRVLDSASGLLSRLQELAVLGANDTNTDADNNAINAEAEAIADEFHRLMSTSTYKGKNIFVDTAGGEYVSMGGRDAEMTFGLGKVEYSEMYVHEYEQFAVEVGGEDPTDDADTLEMAALALLETAVVMNGATYVVTQDLTAAEAAEVSTGTAGLSAAADGNGAGGVDGDGDDGVSARATAGDTFTANANQNLISLTVSNDPGTGRVAKAEGQLRYTASEGMYTGDGATSAVGNPQTNLLTTVIQNVQAKINTARVQAGSQYAALESAVNYTTDLTAQYELGYNTVNDVNFSMETAHLAKNQILQQAATAMLAQANQGQQGLLQLIS
jgi:flagellin